VRRIGPPVALGVLLLALTPASALAKHHTKPPPEVQQILKRCGDSNSLGRGYPVAVLRQALADLTTSAKVYTVCAQEIQNAINAELGPSRGAPNASSAVRKRVAENAGKELKQAQAAGSQPVDLGGARIAAGAVQVNGGSLLSVLPTPILIVLVALILLGAVPLGLRLSSIVRARRTR